MASVRLTVYGGAVSATAATTRMGGVPSVPAGFSWPRCADCDQAMLFLGQVYLAAAAGEPPGDPVFDGAGTVLAERGRVIAIFMCGLAGADTCETWSAFAGANRALVLPAADLRPAEVPAGAGVLREDTAAVEFVDVDAEDKILEEDELEPEEVAGYRYSEVRETWSERSGRSTRQVLGSVGGAPYFFQGESPSACPQCGRVLGFVAHLESGHDHRTEVNFGGGLGYVFACDGCEVATFQWSQ